MMNLFSASAAVVVMVVVTIKMGTMKQKEPLQGLLYYYSLCHPEQGGWQCHYHGALLLQPLDFGWGTRSWHCRRWRGLTKILPGHVVLHDVAGAPLLQAYYVSKVCRH
jgi:hypothetical protein